MFFVILLLLVAQSLTDKFGDVDGQLLFECGSPRDSVFFLLLNMLVGHVSCVVEDINEAFHHLAAVLTGINKLIEHSLLFDKAFLASSSLAGGVEKLFEQVVLSAWVDDLLR